MNAYGFEKVAPDDAAGTGIERHISKDSGADMGIIIGDETDDIEIEAYRPNWRTLCEKHPDSENPHDLSQELKTEREAQELRASVAAELKESVLEIRTRLGRGPSVQVATVLGALPSRKGKVPRMWFSG